MSRYLLTAPSQPTRAAWRSLHRFRWTARLTAHVNGLTCHSIRKVHGYVA